MHNRNTVDAKDRASTRTLLPLVALGGGLIVTPAMALELGELTVESSLGQPLRASIAYALAPNEMVSNTCVSVSAGQSTGGLPGIGSNTVTITERAIVITGVGPVREPMLGTRVTINCPYTPNLSREYMLFVDPASVAGTTQLTAPTARPESEPQLLAPPVAAPVARVEETPIGQSTRYRVQPGDTLSGITGRIENRSMALWPAVNAIFAANPDAFIDNDPNKLKAGAWLTIPSLDGTAPVIAAAPASAPIEPVPAGITAPGENIETTAVTGQATSYDPAAFDTSPVTPAEESPALDTATVMDSTADLKPGDLVPNGMLDTPDTTVAIPDTELDGPQTTSTSPNVPTAIVSTGARNESTSLLVWLVGGGLAIAAFLLLFGRRVRGRFGSAPVGAAAGAQADRRQTATEAEDIFSDYDIEDDSPTEENLVLDADLEIGTGLEQGVEVDVAQDFGFAATTELDVELPFEPEAPAADSDTDIIPPMKVNVGSILESEVLPDDDDYDMSVIVDATKMPQHEEVTERDLQAVEVDPNDETRLNDNFTISQEVDYDILEQDYEDELTATQALNQEIERAAAELARDLNKGRDDDATYSMPKAVTEDLTATNEMPARDADKTAEFEASYDPNDTNAVTVNMSSDDKQSGMRVANDDETVEMDIEGGKVDTRKG